MINICWYLKRNSELYIHFFDSSLNSKVLFSARSDGKFYDEFSRQSKNLELYDVEGNLNDLVREFKLWIITQFLR